MKIAICSDISQFHKDQLMSRDWSKQFLGSSWATSLYEHQTEMNIQVASGDIALQRIKSGQWQAKDVHIVQEMDAQHGLTLCQMGAIPSVLTMFESPLVAYRSVDRLKRLRFKFAHCIGPRTVFDHVPILSQSCCWPLTFPSYWRNHLVNPATWSLRKHAVLIAANKYWRERKWAHVRNLKDALRILRHGLRKQLSTTYQSCWRSQLHDARLDLIGILGTRNKIEVYGRGWNDMSNLPKIRHDKLTVVQSVFKGPCDDKHELLSHYKFTIAYENTAFPGYVTEKIIDAMVAGSIPVYYGAPDISTMLPADTFIDARAFRSTEAICDYMDQLSENDSDEMISAGQRFLKSASGQRYTYEGFAEWIVSLIRENTESI